MRCGGSGGGFAAGDANDAEDGEIGQGGARDEDTVGGRIEIGRRDLDAVIEKGEEVVGDDAFENFAIEIAQANPQTVELGTA